MGPPTDEERVSDAPDRDGIAESAADETTPLIAGESAAEPGDGTGDASNLNISEHERRWKRQRWISLCVSILLMAVVIVLIVLFGVYRSRRIPPGHALCLTPACVHAASEILYNLSPNYQEIDPCSNFNELVCGGWGSRHDLRPDQGFLSTFGVMAEDSAALLRHILEAPYPDTSNHSSFSPMNLAAPVTNIDRENFDELQRAYNTCMAITDIQKVGIAPIERVLNEISVLYPVKGSQLDEELSPGSDSGSIADVVAYFEKRGVDIIESLVVGPDDKDPDVVVVFASPVFSIGLPAKSYYLNQEILDQYQDAMSQVLGAVHPSKIARAKPAKVAASVVAFESRIAAVIPDLQDLRDITKSYNIMSVKETAKLAPQLGLDLVLKSLVPPSYQLQNMITSFPEYLTNVSGIMESTPRDTLQAFFFWKAIQSLSGAVEAPEIKPYTRFMNKLQGKEPDASPERWRTCINHVHSALGWYLSRFYVEAAFSAKAKDLGNQIVSDIKEQFIARLVTLDWMSEDVKALATEKVKQITQKIGYPNKSPDVMDPPSVHDYYNGLDITDTFFDNVVSVREFQVKQSWSQLGKPTDRDQWGLYASEVNAYYNPAGNEIVFPAGIMQFPVFGSGLPSYINYGAFGAVAGHELSHAFDNNGRHYDVRGNYTEWWDNRTVAAFEGRAECFVGEYDNFTAEGTNGTLHVNGRQTLGENIADAGGLNAAYAVWQKHRQAYPDMDLPGLDFFTQEQLFYVAYGNFWCSKYTKAALTRSIFADEHSPSFARVEGTAMLNSRGFREAFDCPVKEPVCELW